MYVERERERERQCKIKRNRLIQYIRIWTESGVPSIVEAFLNPRKEIGRCFLMDNHFENSSRATTLSLSVTSSPCHLSPRPAPAARHGLLRGFQYSRGCSETTLPQKRLCGSTIFLHHIPLSTKESKRNSDIPKVYFFLVFSSREKEWTTGFN